MNVARMVDFGLWAWTGGEPGQRGGSMLHLPGKAAEDASVRGGPWRWAYAALGMVLAFGAPAGLALMNMLEVGRLSVAGLRAELANDRYDYLYVLASTMVVFVLFGYVLGRRAEEFVALANTDSLTGLNNARLLRVRLDQEFARAARYQTPLSLLLIDLDGLKQINDRSGHRAGDAALEAVAAALRGGSRAADIVARWGGDEFALLAPHTEGGAAALLAERIRGAVAADTASSPEALTVSVGLATLGDEAAFASPDALIAAADAALYQAKRSGKNSVVAWSERNSHNAQLGQSNGGRRGRPTVKGGC